MLEVENNSLLDYNTNSGNSNAKIDLDQFVRMSDVNEKGETILNLALKIT